MEKITEAKKKKMERVRNGGYPSTSNGGLHKDRGDLLQKENCGCKKPKSPINTRDFEMSTKLPVIIQKSKKSTISHSLHFLLFRFSYFLHVMCCTFTLSSHK
jgi:hypothetical protein